MNIDMWNKCALEGEELDRRVGELLNSGDLPYSTSWAIGGPLIESNEVFLEAPSRVHINGGPNNGWHDLPFWRATVSSRVRTYPNPNSALYPGCVGRGMGETPLIAAMRAIVMSFGEGAASQAAKERKA
ncbi:hypothetical protein [Pandoraea norimbergensis]